MAKRPYIFTRYQLATENELLGFSAQENFFRENQGAEIEHVTRGSSGEKFTLIMEPVPFEGLSGGSAISFRVGIRRLLLEVEDYDRRRERRRRRLVENVGNIQSAHFIAVPDQNLMAIEDRSGDFNIRATSAINALKVLVREILTDGSLDLQYVSDDDVRRAIETWDLIEYSYTARPLNPIDHTALAQARTDLYKQENVIRDTAKLRPPEGQSLKMNGGIIEATQELSEVGYAQNGVRGYTSDGQLAQIPKPHFHEDRQKNLREREKPRYIRVFLEVDDDEDEAFAQQAVATLLGFYNGNS